jgi:hypothetical protein
MRLQNVAALTVGIVACGSASAHRGIPVDTWEGGENVAGSSLVFNSSSTLPSGTLPSWVSSLTLTPGTSVDQSDVEIPQPGQPAGDLYIWDPTQGDDGSSAEEGVQLHPTTSTLTVEFDYTALSCSSETASLTLDGMSFSAANPCNKGVILTGVYTPVQYNASTFVFGLNSSGKVALEGALPIGWSETAAAAPEMGTAGLVSSMALLAGGLAVAFGRRRRDARPG